MGKLALQRYQDNLTSVLEATAYRSYALSCRSRGSSYRYRGYRQVGVSSSGNTKEENRDLAEACEFLSKSCGRRSRILLKILKLMQEDAVLVDTMQSRIAKLESDSNQNYTRLRYISFCDNYRFRISRGLTTDNLRHMIYDASNDLKYRYYQQKSMLYRLQHNIPSVIVRLKNNNYCHIDKQKMIAPYKSKSFHNLFYIGFLDHSNYSDT